MLRLGLSREGFNAETVETTVRMMDELRGAAATVSCVGRWLSSLGYTVPSEISVR